MQTILSSSCRNKRLQCYDRWTKFFFDQPVKNNLKTYNNIRKIAADQGYDCTTGCLLDYNYFKNYYKMIAIDLSNEQSIDANPKAIEEINFTGNLHWPEGATMFSIIEEAKKTVLDFLHGTVKYSNIIFALMWNDLT